MRKAVALLFIICAASIGAQAPSAPAQVAGPGSAQAAPEWKSFNYAEDGFKASFPSEPDFTKNLVPTETGTIQFHNYSLQDGPAALLIGVVDFGTFPGKDPDVQLQGGMNGALENSKSHLIREQKINMGKYHGLEFEGENNQSHIKARLYLVDDALYQVVVVTPIGGSYALADRFFNSFKLIPKTPDSPAPQN